MDKSTISGISLAVFGLIAGFLVQEHFNFNLLLFLFQPAALLIVFVGTIGAVIASFPLSEIVKVPSLFKMVLTEKLYDEVEIVNDIAELSKKLKKDGLLGLEYDSNSNPNPLVRKGLTLIIYDVEPENIKETLEREISLRETLYENGEKIFHSAGGFAPTMGVIGTIMGMAGVLKGISDINSIGSSVSTAFISTLYGVCSANILWIPFANKIKFRLEKESRINHMILEGILSIKHGNNSKIIREKLNLPLLERMR